MKEFDEDDIDLDAPLDVRFVVIGFGMMIFGLTLPLFYLENIYFKYLCFLIFLSSFFVMTKRETYY